MSGGELPARPGVGVLPGQPGAGALPAQHGTLPEDAGFMREALAEARQALYSTAPNPRVGCVIVREGVIVGRGFHARAGEPHAEVFALREAGVAARGATAYVTLEPCSHHGRTPPCADAVIAAGIARVVYAVGDPDPRVDGRGAAKLRAAGIEVLQGVLESEARELNLGFLRRASGGLPWVRAKVGASLDGRTALADGRSKWITSAEARADVQRLRAEAGVVLTGIGTVLADDPALTVRDPVLLAALRGREVVRAVVDPAGRLPADAQLRDGTAPTWWLVEGVSSEGAYSAEWFREKSFPGIPPSGKHGSEVADSGIPSSGIPNAEISTPGIPPSGRDSGAAVQTIERITLPANSMEGTGRPSPRAGSSTPGVGRPPPHAVLELLAARGVNDVLLEAGATLTGAWLAAGVVDELVVYYAPRLLGETARPLAQLAATTMDPLAASPAWQLHDATPVGTDLRVTWRRIQI